MLRLPSGVVLDGEREVVYRSVDDEQAAGDGVYAADVAEATGLPEARVRALLDQLVGEEVLETGRTPDETYGLRYLRSRGS